MNRECREKATTFREIGSASGKAEAAARALRLDMNGDQPGGG
jgi:hypothetical protein